MIAPGMALMFLMWNVTAGGVSFLVERRETYSAAQFGQPDPKPIRSFASPRGFFCGICTGLDPGAQDICLSALIGQLWLAVLVLVALSAYGALGWGHVSYQFSQNACPGLERRQCHWFAFSDYWAVAFLPITTLPDC